MSGEVIATPVAKYGRSSEFGVVLDFIQTMISDDTLRQAFNIPHLVMVGRQNMAKTTLINRLIGRYLLPMRRNETANTLQARTTYPIILNLRNSEKSLVEVKCDLLGLREAAENPKDDAVETFLNQVTAHLPKEEGTPISKTPVNVTLQGPEFTTLTLVDLPGAHFANDDLRMNLVTQDLVLEYIEKNTNSIIVIVSEAGDPTGDSAINLVMQKAPDFRSRTICALTKPDKLRESDDMGKRVAMNGSSFTLDDNRFIVLRGVTIGIVWHLIDRGWKDGTDPAEKDWDAETTRVHEKEWFARHPQYKDIQHVCGIDRLMDIMISLLAEKMITEIPFLVTLMKKRKKEVDETLVELEDSEVPESNEGKGGVAMKLKESLIRELNILLFNNTSDTAGGERVRHLFNSFHQEVFKVNPLEMRNDYEIRRQKRKLEGVAAPLGDSSENSQLLQRLLYEKYTVVMRNQMFLGKPTRYHEIRRLYARSNANGKPVTRKGPVDHLLPLSENLVCNVETTLRDIVQRAIEQPCQTSQLSNKLLKRKSSARFLTRNANRPRNSSNNSLKCRKRAPISFSPQSPHLERSVSGKGFLW
ncbi:unnamed protein product [Pocillopora meandrina]|uniref:Dynamin GTPase domain-containing protein n=1 Tax=Pocillopora meandrina TaxID=46732 RepID=A0AAU9XRT2_9CNID|nr:unnamed protein product [Pocillopora meandrina]